jgi:hypothetical protein
MRIFVVIAVVTLLGSACSQTGLAYRKADWLLEHYAWKTVRTSDAQREDWQPLLQAKLRQHREQELPLLIAYLDLAGRIIRETEGSVGTECLVDGALLLYQRHARLAADLAAPLLAELDADQVRHLTGYTRRRLQDSVERYLDPDPQRRKAARQERITDRIEKWTGRLNDNQQQHIRDALERIPDLSPSWYAFRTQRTDTLLAMFETGASADTLQEYIDSWWVHMDGTSAETRQHWRVARHEFIQLMDTLATTLTNGQRATFEKRIGNLRRELAAFVTQAPQPVNLQVLPACASSSV